jgi:hypothetical protein
MSEPSPQYQFLNHLLDSVLPEAAEAELREDVKKTRRGPRKFIELLPSDDDRDLLDANDGKLADAIATAFDAYGSKHQDRARFELADLDGDDYEDDPEDDDDADDSDADDGDATDG